MTMFNKDHVRSETIRYLGYGKKALEPTVESLVTEVSEETIAVARPRFVTREFSLEVQGETVSFGTIKTKSKDLAKNLAGCQGIIVLGATIGVALDQLTRRYSATDMARVVVLQAVGAAVLEEYLDEYNNELKAEYAQVQQYLRPRFSPGYGDFGLESQSAILQLLEAGKTIGLTLTDGGMLNPTKSVTAVIGVSGKEEACRQTGCESCGMKDCIGRI